MKFIYVFCTIISFVYSCNFNPDLKSECILFKKAEEFYNIKSTGVLHLGASIGEELEFYDDRHVKKVFYIEANPPVFEQLVQRVKDLSLPLDVRTFCFAACSEEKELQFFVTSNLKSSSLLEMAQHKTLYPTITETETITVQGNRVDQVLNMSDLEGINTMVLDIQGGELDALRGSAAFLSQIDFIVCEVHFAELYAGSPRIESLDEFLLTHNFRRIDTISNAISWGDALYINKRFLEQ